jgi:D-isomer specific 2-hydroxyacid dehydrogenase, NAD binding domain
MQASLSDGRHVVHQRCARCMHQCMRTMLLPCMVFGRTGRTMGIVGYGDIGKACGQLAKAFKMRVIALRRNPCANPEDGVLSCEYGPDQLCQLVGESDYVVMATPFTDQVRADSTSQICLCSCSLLSHKMPGLRSATCSMTSMSRHSLCHADSQAVWPGSICSNEVEWCLYQYRTRQVCV